MEDILIEQVVGNRLKMARTRKGLNLDAVAKLAGMTAASLSKIENGKVSSPISTYYKLAAVLGIKFDKLMGDHSNTGCLVVRKNDPSLKSETKTGYSYSYKALGSDWSDKAFTPFILTYEPQSEDTPIPKFTFDGQEFIFVLDGTLEFHHGEEKAILEPGDCVFVEGSTPHGGIVYGGKKATALLFSVPNPNALP